jgi:hypothetical protein
MPLRRRSEEPFSCRAAATRSPTPRRSSMPLRRRSEEPFSCRAAATRSPRFSSSRKAISCFAARAGTRRCSSFLRPCTTLSVRARTGVRPAGHGEEGGSGRIRSSSAVTPILRCGTRGCAWLASRPRPGRAKPRSPSRRPPGSKSASTCGWCSTKATALFP